jgi:hypothetical protein
VDIVVSETAAEEGHQDDDPSPPADLLAFAPNCQLSDHIPPAHLAKLMSDAINKHTSKGPNTRSVNASIALHNTAPIVYLISRSTHVDAYRDALIDSGSNGGLAGKEMCIIETYDNGHTVDIEGIDRHCMCQIPLGSAGAVVKTQLGPVIAVVHNYTLIGQGKTIHSVGQIEAYHHCVHDKSIKVGGLQSIHTFDGYILPLNICIGLLYLSMRPFTDEEWDSLPHIILTSECEWDPSSLDRELDNDEKWFDALSKEVECPLKGIFNLRGEYEKRTVLFHDSVAHIPVDKAYLINARGITQHNEPDYELLHPKFGWLSADIIWETFCNTTQYVQIPGRDILKKRYKSPFLLSMCFEIRQISQ